MARFTADMLTRFSNIALGTYVGGLGLGLITSNLATLFGVILGFIVVVGAYCIGMLRIQTANPDNSLLTDFADIVDPLVKPLAAHLFAIMLGIILVVLYVNLYPV